jgi:hypothetical protein
MGFKDFFKGKRKDVLAISLVAILASYSGNSSADSLKQGGIKVNPTNVEKDVSVDYILSKLDQMAIKNGWFEYYYIVDYKNEVLPDPQTKEFKLFKTKIEGDKLLRALRIMGGKVIFRKVN